MGRRRKGEEDGDGEGDGAEKERRKGMEIIIYGLRFEIGIEG